MFLLSMLGAGFPAFTVRAAAGTVYTCSITPSYGHPVTGVIEDSGGEASYATGQGMVEGCVSTVGMMEVADEGGYYLTFRLGLMDYTSNHSFQVQNAGDSGWSSTSAAVTGSGTDSNGTTNDICIEVPSENCVVRGSMYVEPMGREVIFYFYPGNFAAGNNSGMTPFMVTEESSGQEATPSESGNQTSGGLVQAQNEDGVQSEVTEKNNDSTDADETAGSVMGETEQELNNAQGLSLSTAKETAESLGTGIAGNQMLTLTASITISVLIILAVGSVIVYYYRKNWRRWGGVDDED